MATYEELLIAQSNDGLNRKVRVAVIVAAETVRTEVDTTSNHAARMVWAGEVFANPQAEAQRMIWAVLAANKDTDLGDSATSNTILGATDAQVQAKVNAAIDVFAV